MTYKRKSRQFYNRYFKEKKKSFWKWFRNWKPIHLCQFFKKKGWKIPKYLIGHPDTEEQTSHNTIVDVYSGRVRVGQKLTISNRTVSKLSFPIKKNGSPTGDVTFTIRKVSDDSIIASKVWGDASDLQTTVTWEEVTFDSPVLINEEVYISVEFSGGEVGNTVWLYYQNTDVKADEYQVRYVTSWSNYTSWDTAYIYTYLPTQKSVSDVGSGVDVVGIKAQVGIQDSGIGSDALSALLAKIGITDQGSGIEVIQKIDQILAQDSGIGDETYLETKEIKAIQDSGIGTDLVQILLKKILLQESGLGSDVIGILSKILIQESGAGVDIAQMKGVVDISDSGIGSDIISAILAKLLIQDSGVGTDQIELVMREFIQDSGVGADLISILQKVLIQDVGLGVDRVKVPPFYSDKYSKQGDAYTDKYQKQKTKYQDKFFY